ncbi:MAG: hypothetical protein IPO91_08265 [Chloroflexi bacterium]|nr:hypothetical protein [Chloroflexota bacterium]
MMRRLIDPDMGLELRLEIMESLWVYLAADRTGKDADEVWSELGLDVSSVKSRLQ